MTALLLKSTAAMLVALVHAQTEADGELRSPLILARRGGNDEIVKMLIAAGAKE